MKLWGFLIILMWGWTAFGEIRFPPQWQRQLQEIVQENERNDFCKSDFAKQYAVCRVLPNSLNKNIPCYWFEAANLPVEYPTKLASRIYFDQNYRSVIASLWQVVGPMDASEAWDENKKADIRYEIDGVVQELQTAIGTARERRNDPDFVRKTLVEVHSSLHLARTRTIVEALNEEQWNSKAQLIDVLTKQFARYLTALWAGYEYDARADVEATRPSLE